MGKGSIPLAGSEAESTRAVLCWSLNARVPPYLLQVLTVLTATNWRRR